MSSRENITPKQRMLLDFIEEYQFNNGASPIIAEMKKAMDVSSDNSILKHLRELERKKYISRDNTPRGIALLEHVKDRLFADVVLLPLLGSVPAGNPVDTFDDATDWVPVSKDIVKNEKTTYMLRVSGESMRDAGILDGDLAVIDSSMSPRVGDKVVALVDNQSTVKTLASNGNSFYLHPENPDFDDIYPEDNLAIQGVVVGIIRRYY
jgi:repressor LexA